MGIRKKVYNLIKYTVVISFVYLIIFENKFNINEIIQRFFNCKTDEIIYFKIVILLILLLSILIIYRFLCDFWIQFGYLFNQNLKTNLLITYMAILILIITIALIVLKKVKLLGVLLFIFISSLSTFIGFSIARKYYCSKKG